MLVAGPAVLIERGALDGIAPLNPSSFWGIFLNYFVAIAFVEEALKYLVVKVKVLNHCEFDEPLDTMLYMIISALGFATSENILILFSLGPTFFLEKAIGVSVFRFIGATFLHTLCSGTVGYFLAKSFSEPRHKMKIMAIGLGISTLLHGLYNFSIMEMDSASSFFIHLAILSGLAIFTSLGFNHLKNLKSICKVNKN